jgi:hypothetical protein
MVRIRTCGSVPLADLDPVPDPDPAFFVIGWPTKKITKKSNKVEIKVFLSIFA